MYSITGQHDMPNHLRGELFRSAYQTLVLARRVINLEEGKPVLIRVRDVELYIAGFPWNAALRPCPKPARKNLIRIAVVHKYAWVKGRSHAMASDNQKLQVHAKQLEGYDVLLFGDNHRHFTKSLPTGQVVCNTGCPMQRRIDERDEVPKFGLLFGDGHLETVDVAPYEKLRFDERAKVTEPMNQVQMDGFIARLHAQGDSAAGASIPSFEDAVKAYIQEHPELTPSVTRVLQDLI
jgi:hypothetical protein